MFEEISPEEIQFYKKTLELDKRYDGRNLCEFREYKIEKDTLIFPNALYGIKITIPNSQNKILIALNGDIKTTDPSNKEKIPNPEKAKKKISEKKQNYLKLEIKTSSVPETPKKALKQENTLKEIEDLLKKFLLKNLNTSKLQITENVHWEIICDIFVIGDLYLNELDYIIKGIKKSLLNCKFPNLSVNYNNWNNEFSYDIIEGSSLLFDFKDIPFIFVVGEFKGKIVLDMSREEIESVNGYYVVGVDWQGRVRDVEKLDGNCVKVNMLGGFIGRLVGVAKELIKNC